MNVYIVDDEPKVRNGLRATIHDYKPEWPMPLTAPDALSALQDPLLLRADLLLVDVRMPGMTGLELLDKVMEAVPERDVQAVIISGYAEFEYARVCMTMGAKDYLLKPVDLTKLYALLDQMEERIERMRREDAELSRQDAAPPATNCVQEVKACLPRVNPVIRKVANYVMQHLAESLKADELAAMVFVHANYLSDLFKKETGVNLSSFIQDNRILMAENELCDLSKKIYMVASDCGFGSQHYFTYVFRKHTGMTPQQYRAAYAAKEN